MIGDSFFQPSSVNLNNSRRHIVSPTRGIRIIEAHHAQFPLDAILAADDEGVALAAAASAALGLRGNTLAAVTSATDKQQTRRAFAAAGLPTPQFREVHNSKEAETATTQFGFPCVVKPLRMSASRGVIRVDDLQQLKKLNIEPRGAIVSACDPSDTGNDPCGFISRQGIVFFNVLEVQGDNGNRKMDEACKVAILDGADSFGYDADGLGATLRDNVSKAFAGKKMSVFAYKGSSSIHFPNAEFKSSTAGLTNKSKTLRNKDVLYNKKSRQ